MCVVFFGIYMFLNLDFVFANIICGPLIIDFSKNTRFENTKAIDIFNRFYYLEDIYSTTAAINVMKKYLYSVNY